MSEPRMRFEVLEPAKEGPPTARLSLYSEGNGVVDLCVSGKDGRKYTLMTFWDGRFRRVSFVDIDDIETDGQGRIREK